MSFKDKLSNILKVSEDEYYDEPDGEDFAEEEDEEPEQQAPRFIKSARESKSEQNNVVSFSKGAGVNNSKLAIILSKPKTMKDALAVADSLNQNKTVILNLESVNGELSRRINDFVSGAAYANDATLSCVANEIFVITPKNVEVNGDVLSALSSGFIFE